jgi:flagellum-specific peptidoglycan hydrolase FlgJ
MFKKTLFFLIIFFSLIACHSTQPAVRSYKRIPPKPKVVHNVKKPATEKPVSGASKNQSLNTDGRTAEVIESTSKTVVYSDVVYGYVGQFKDIAMGNMKTYGIPASIILAQGILESGAGRGDLALTANNHFGIKCHNDWTGESVRHDDDSEQECFRKYKDPAESYKDHALFLTTRGRYASLFTLPKGDYEAWAKGLRAAGYATDPKYPDKLISYIERYNLHQYDAQVLGMTFTPVDKQPEKMVNTEPQEGSFYEVQKGDTLYSISKKFNLSVDDLKQKNKLSDNALSVGQKLRV